MTIKKDAGELLGFFYEEYTNNYNVTPEILMETTKWKGDRLNRALHYLCDLSLLELEFGLETYDGLEYFHFERLTPLGIQVIEDEKKFQKNFSFTFNLGVFKYSWGARER